MNIKCIYMIESGGISHALGPSDYLCLLDHQCFSLYPPPNVVGRGVYWIHRVRPSVVRPSSVVRLWTEWFPDISSAVFAPICLKFKMKMSFGPRKKPTRGIFEILKFTILAEFFLVKWAIFGGFSHT